MEVLRVVARRKLDDFVLSDDGGRRLGVFADDEILVVAGGFGHALRREHAVATQRKVHGNCAEAVYVALDDHLVRVERRQLAVDRVEAVVVRYDADWVARREVVKRTGSNAVGRHRFGIARERMSVTGLDVRALSATDRFHPAAPGIDGRERFEERRGARNVGVGHPD